MSVFSGIEPEKVFEFFEEICMIPHGSGNTRQLSDHLKAFAAERSLRVNQEPCGNIIIYKDATPGYEKSPAICLQGHMDMVCEKTSDSRHNFRKDPLPIAVMDDEVFSRNTTLGADDGIAVAMILAVLDSSELEHPALEAVFTIDEETGMEGAKLLNYDSLKARRVINLDSEDEGVFYISCAGGLRGNISLPVDMKEQVKLAGSHYKTFTDILGAKTDRSAGENKMLVDAYNTLLYYYVNCIDNMEKGKEVAAKLLELDPENEGAKAVMGMK